MNIDSNRLPEPILVTGALGFIGQRLIERLLQDNYSVIAFLRPHHILPTEWQGKVQLFRGDITRKDDIESAVAQAKTVFHLVAIVSDWGAAETHHNITVEGTRFLLQAVVKHHVRLILASSITVYGDRINQGMCHESMDHGQPLGAYSASKQAQENLARDLIGPATDIRIVRPANIYGAGSRPWVDDLSAELKKHTPVLINQGNFDAGLVHVDNVIDLFMLVASLPQAKGEIYNVCDMEGITWQRYINALANIIDAPKPRSIPKWLAQRLAGMMEFVWRHFHLKGRPPLTHEALNLIGSQHQISMIKATSELDYHPKVMFDEGMQDVANYIKTQQTRSHL
ncbi:NAD-dependent epimerase/dehydratase family protein [Alteromonas sp. a30]|uniref:NAD-dependent epimerase/dehydratase family protein n=1 Tax=Alteromonas sp. a30 TaxID=2730917 RepID=UPI00227ED6DA|nr:NAD(P)-dependent oxidoreductase [Alteromonas sp. a30]MCY7295485.1 NAD(P)-dependent oxidoreductase [Alteromonas sp. a30]